ncbi:MAG TPA: alpha-glucuronidase family glycosyl hydrolase [Hanamia sp.]|nr:alpha-glucuronidase family glycosyl hydrolase [Hanamia sp.]
MMKKVFFTLVCIFLFAGLHAENGYRLWLRYDKIDDAKLLSTYQHSINAVNFSGNNPTLQVAKKELLKGLEGLLDKKLINENSISNGTIICGTPESSADVKLFFSLKKINELGDEGFIIRNAIINKKKVIFIVAKKNVGVLYGVFHFLRLLQTHQYIEEVSITSIPKLKYRILDHWDNLDRYVERGYAGISIWDWHTLPDYIDQRYIDYARANASIGINGTVLTNVNANSFVLTKQYLVKVKALADVFRPYGIRVFLTARFSSPIEIGGLKTADPLDPQVQKWWNQKANEIYSYIPDFGGFLVKANSEGQPGPQNYGRTHADGANMLAVALAPHGGIVMWRSFVYSNETPNDRFKQAYDEFKPLDGKFRKNVMVQVKNGPIDFQPREPFSPLFGAMPKTPLMMEFQITQEYLGQGTHLVYEAPLFKEVLNADTYEKGKGSTVAKVIDGSLDHHELSGMAGVSNIGNDINWTGHPFGQANWYAFGRIAWNDELSAKTIADEWIRQTFSNNKTFVDSVKKMMIVSREAVVNYMTPLGLHHIMGYGNHYGPAPWYDKAPRADWNPVYFHRADSIGIGFDRTSKGSNALAQYQPEVDSFFTNLSTCPEEFLLWFHHVPWNYKMPARQNGGESGRTLWDELCYKYNEGVDEVRWMQATWKNMEKYIDEERFNHVRMLLNIQEEEAVWWRNACLLYFQTFSKMPIPANYEKPDHILEYYESLYFPYAPGNGK